MGNNERAHIFIKDGESPEDAFDRALNRQPKKKDTIPKTDEKGNTLVGYEMDWVGEKGNRENVFRPVYKTPRGRYITDKTRFKKKLTSAEEEMSRQMRTERNEAFYAKLKEKDEAKDKWDKENIDIKYLEKYKGEPHTFEVYRAGDLEGKATGAVYFAMSKHHAEEYRSGSFSAGGKVWRYSKREVNKYKISVKKPLVVSASDDAEAAEIAFKTLFGKNVKLTDVNKALKLNYKFTGGANNTYIFLDMANTAALKKAGYDSLIYKTSFIGGRYLNKRRVTQVIVPAKSKAVKKVKE